MRAKTVRKKVAVLWVLGVIVLGWVGFTVWFAYNSTKAANDSLQSANKVSSDTPRLPQIKTYADCQKSPGSKTLLTYPAQCMTASGKTFTDTSQKYLVITEWGVRIPLKTDDIADAEYTLNGTKDMAHITTSSIASAITKVSGCHNGLDDVYLSRSKTEPELQPNWGPKKIGSYYYSQGSVVEPLCVTVGNDNNLTVIRSIQSSLLKAVPQVEANQ